MSIPLGSAGVVDVVKIYKGNIEWKIQERRGMLEGI